MLTMTSIDVIQNKIPCTVELIQRLHKKTGLSTADVRKQTKRDNLFP